MNGTDEGVVRGAGLVRVYQHRIRASEVRAGVRRGRAAVSVGLADAVVHVDEAPVAGAPAGRTGQSGTGAVGAVRRQCSARRESCGAHADIP